MTPLPPFLAPEKARFLPVPPELQGALFPAKLCLFEWTDYWFQWRGATHLQIGDTLIEPFAPELFRVRWENALGASFIEPFCGEKSLDAPLFVEVISPKFPTPRAHFEFFGALLGELFERAAPLPFDFGGETARGIENSNYAPSPLWTRLFLEQFGARLETALRRFALQPPREMETERFWQDAHHAPRCDGDSLIQTARQPQLWRRERGFFRPTQLAQNRAIERVDSPENRFVALFVRRLLGALESLENHELSALRGVCALLSAQFPAWNAENNAISPSLWRRGVTRELIELWRLWNGAGAPLFGRYERAARLRDVAQLYEFWAFFALCEAIGVVLNQKPRFEFSVDEVQGLKPLSRAHFAAGTLVFNGPAPSYSTPLRPDFLWLENGRASLAFDAKFRLDAPQTGANGADLHKMHAYRDALGVKSAVAIYPGTRSLFHFQSGANNEFSLRDVLSGAAAGVGFWGQMPGALFHPKP